MNTVTTEEASLLADAWLEFWKTRNELKSDDQYYSDLSDLLDDALSPACECGPEGLWLFVQTIYPRPMTDRLFAILAAGPLEDLIVHHGPEFIDRIEIEARQNPRFRDLLGGVWGSSAPGDVWPRIQRIQGPTW